MPAGLKLRSAKVVGVRFVCCDVVARSCGLATLLRSRDIVCGVAELRSCGVAELRRCCGVAELRILLVAELRSRGDGLLRSHGGAALLSCRGVVVWSQCGRSVVAVWSWCGHGVVRLRLLRSCGVAELWSRGVVESRSCRSLKLQTV